MPFISKSIFYNWLSLILLTNKTIKNIDMKRVFLSLIYFLPVFLFAQFNYPDTKKVDTVTNYHGTMVADPYRWLEDDQSEETKQWVTEENKVTFGFLDKIPYRAQWLKRLEEINNYPKYSSPSRKNEYFYFSKNDGLQNQSVLYRQKGLDGEPELVLDPNKFSADGTTGLGCFFSFKRWQVCGSWKIKRRKRLAYFFCNGYDNT